jgi:hypothetical protein
MRSRNHLAPSSAKVITAGGQTRKPEPARSPWRWLSALFAEVPSRDSRQILADHYVTEARVARRLPPHTEGWSGHPNENGHSMALAARKPV